MPARPKCRYCEEIHLVDLRYRVKPAKHDADSSFPRCDIHWRFACDVCGRSHHFNGVAWCPTGRQFVCVSCARSQRAVRKPFWRWKYYYGLGCPTCGRTHAALDRLEFERKHPWQRNPALARAKRGLSPEEEIVPPWTSRVLPPDEDDVTDRKIAAQWDALADWWSSGYGEEGDKNRQYVIDPALFRILGDVKGLRVFDAGCGNGYLSRLLAKRGAVVEAQDISRTFVAMAVEQDRKQPLGIRYRQGSLVDLSPWAGATFDLVVSNLVLQDVRDYEKAIREVARVLKPGGRFVFSIMHPAFASPPVRGWIQEPRDSNRNEDRQYVKVDRYFDRATERWGFGDTPQVTSFHRPLRDYFDVLARAGFVVRGLEEPVPSKEAIEERPRDFLNEHERIPLFLILDAVRRP
ncbi:MAG TPA: class I SAM-dependent methyltransferase [Thermoplasmata archaeon]|nr:class I SAM-dependent methyltransferase [Thermoplasmata archaeon]